MHSSRSGRSDGGGRRWSYIANVEKKPSSVIRNEQAKQFLGMGFINAIFNHNINWMIQNTAFILQLLNYIDQNCASVTRK